MSRLKTLPPMVAPLAPTMLVQDARVHVPSTRLDREKLRHADRNAAQPWRAWYNLKRWKDLRQVVFARDGYRCQQTGTLCIGKHPAGNSPVADHIVPHNGDPVLFWDPANVQTVSKEYHDSEKQRIERAGVMA